MLAKNPPFPPSLIAMMRRALDLSQERLARLVGLCRTQGEISAFEQGKSYDPSYQDKVTEYLRTRGFEGDDTGKDFVCILK